MKKLFLLLLPVFFCGSQFAQTYMNVKNKDGSVQYAQTDLVRSLSFNTAGTILKITMTTGTVICDTLVNFQKITFDNTGNGSVLPVELVSFSANVAGNSIILCWQTATEINTSAFEIERAAYGSNNWNKAGSLRAAGNSNAPQYYSFTDPNPLSGNSSYRLKSIDNDGSFKFSNVLSVSRSAAMKFQLSQNFPNPFNPTTTIAFNLPVQGLVDLKIYDVLGNVVTTLVNEEKAAGNYTVQFDAGKFSSGVYFYKLTIDGVSICKKMSVIK